MLTTQEHHQFEKDGFLIVKEVVPPDLVAQWRHEGERLIADNPNAARRIWHERVLFRRPVFRRLLDLTRLIEAEQSLLGDDVQLLALDLLMARPGQGDISWHRDVTFAANKTLSINTALYLQDMTEATGPLRVVSGSHRRDESPPPHDGPREDETLVFARAGDAVLFDAALWHSGSPNRSEQPRLGLFAFFGKYFIKRMDAYFTQSLPAELLQSTDPLKRQLLGLGLSPGVASYHGDSEDYNRRGEVGLDYTNNQ